MNHVRHSLSIFTLLLALACGGSSDNRVPNTTSSLKSPTISVQPVSQITIVGKPTTFSVVADGSGPLSYQWYWNGLPVDGATTNIFTAPVAVSSDDQSTLIVRVANNIGSVTSNSATLSVNGSPRSPKAGDLRFKDVDAFPLELVGGFRTNLGLAFSGSGQNYWGSPLSIGWPGPNVPDGNPYNATWYFIAEPLSEINTMPGRSTLYKADNLNSLQLALGSISPDTIVASLDVCGSQNAFAVELIKTTATQQFVPAITGTLPSTDLQALATQQGLLGHVITAVTVNGTAATYLSYGWQGDESTIYEAKVETVTADTVSVVATTLAGEGYIITAVGGNHIDGFILVGTKVQGDNTPRPIKITSTPSAGRGYSLVGYIFNNDLADSSSSNYLCIYEQ